MHPLSVYHGLLALIVGACWIWAILRLQTYKDPARKFVSALEAALGNFVCANLTAIIAGYSIIPSRPDQIGAGNSFDKISNTWRLVSQDIFNVSSIAALWALLLVADGLFIVTRYQWYEPFSRKKVFSLAPFVSWILFALSIIYLVIGLYFIYSRGKDDDRDLNQVVVWQVMFNLILMILDCMLTALGYIAYQRTRDNRVVATTGALYLLALYLFASRNIGNVLWDWQWGALGTTQPTPSLQNLRDVLDMALFAATLLLLAVLGQREGLTSPGSQSEEGYTAVAGDDQELENRGPTQA